MSTTHTPGPWIARGKHSPWVQTPGAQGAVICHVHGNPERTEEQAAADAKLLAAAPDLLAALVALLDKPGPLFHLIPEGEEKHWPQIAAAREILAKIGN